AAPGVRGVARVRRIAAVGSAPAPLRPRTPTASTRRAWGSTLHRTADCGAPHPQLWLAGPLLNGARWEATAVPALRVHAARAATHAEASLAHMTP
ncbi:MAG TPA: hypothetical protein PLX31_16855, partial [Gemmatimonadaceae bacterium]|nr:hypothetical protein [Gemmatimonadaceae bacterium]